MLSIRSISVFTLIAGLASTSFSVVASVSLKESNSTEDCDVSDSENDDSESKKVLNKLRQSGLTEGELFSVLNFSNVVKSVINSVVSIVAVQSPKEDDNEMDQFSKGFKGTPFEHFFKNFAGRDQQRKVRVGGSGFFIKVEKDVAYVATNCHIVENTVRVKILLQDKTEVPAIVHGSDPRTDLAVLKVKMQDIPEEQRLLIRPLKWGDSSRTEVGHWVLAFGNPFGLGNTVTHGIVSAKSRDIHAPGSGSLTDDFIQHSAQINMGNSGGCLTDVYGYVIGMNTVIITPSGGNVGIGFAISSNNARKVLDRLVLDKKIRHGALGISIQDFSKEMAEGLGSPYRHGAIVTSVDPRGPAHAAGLQVGDVIVKFDDTEITGKSKLSRVVGEASVNTEHKVIISRGNKEIALVVVLGDLDKINGTETDNTDEDCGKPVELFGASLSDSASNSVGQKPGSNVSGIFVIKVNPDSPFDDSGVVPGDIITEVNREPVKTISAFKSIISHATKEKRRFVLMRVRHGDVDRFVSLKIDEEGTFQKEAKNKSREDAKKEDSNDNSSKPKSSESTKDGNHSERQYENNTDDSESESDVPKHKDGASSRDSEYGASPKKRGVADEDNRGTLHNAPTTHGDSTDSDDGARPQTWSERFKRGLKRFKDVIGGLFSSGRRSSIYH
ncbi:MAG: trypsin-like peptidase domain-containing protein [Holosporales bacterium]|jgi:serine protease Do|nr:trypsin-like peptidase domain-containing protein [Holosporales bacterium]